MKKFIFLLTILILFGFPIQSKAQPPMFAGGGWSIDSNGDLSPGSRHIALGDDIQIKFGDTGLWFIEYAEDDQDTLNIHTAITNGTNDDYALLTIAVDTANSGVDADQEVFEIGKGGQDDGDGNFSELLALDEDGDLTIAGAFVASGSISGVAGDLGDGNLTNVGNIALDSISSDAGTSIEISNAIKIPNSIGTPTATTDAVMLGAGDRGGTAGKAGLIIVGEDNTQYIFSDRAGLGTITPGEKLTVQIADSVSDGFKVTDGNGYVYFYDGTTAANTFAPTVLMNTATDKSGMVWTNIPAGQDSGSSPIFIFRATLDGGTVGTRPLFDFRNNATTVFQITATARTVFTTTSNGQIISGEETNLADDASVSIETNWLDDGIFEAVSLTGDAVCVWALDSSANSVTFIGGTDASCAEADTDDDLCMIADGDNTFSLKNRLGGERDILIEAKGI